MNRFNFTMFAGNDCFIGMLLIYNDRRLGGSVESIILFLPRN